MSEKPERLMIVTVDPSGDEIAALLMASMQKCKPCLFIGAAGSKSMPFFEEGINIIKTSFTLKGVIHPHLLVQNILRVRHEHKEIYAMVRKWQPSKVLLIDGWQYMLPLAKRLRREFPSIEKIKYITPQVWASRKGRIKALRAEYDRLLCLFDFEAGFLRAHGAMATPVGNPLLVLPEIEEVRKQRIARKPGAQGRARKIVLLPGSRHKEAMAQLRFYLDCVGMLHKNWPDSIFHLVAPQHLASDMEQMLQNTHTKINLCTGDDRYHAFTQADLALSSFGTMTMQLALMGVPCLSILPQGQVKGFLFNLLVDRFCYVRYFCLPNIMLDGPYIPELCGRKGTRNHILATLYRWVEEPSLRKEQLRQLAGLHEKAGLGSSLAMVLERTCDAIEATARRQGKNSV